jgi:hypothetical protein
VSCRPHLQSLAELHSHEAASQRSYHPFLRLAAMEI